MNKETVSLVVWTTVFLAFELPAHFWSRCPWFTLSQTVWKGESWWWPISIFVLGFIVVLTAHLELHWSVRWLLVITAVGVFLIVSRLLEHLV